MKKEQYEKIIEEVAKKHHLIIDKSDPIFAILTANEIVLNDYVNKIDQVNSINLLNLENQYEKIVNNSKELAENKIGLAVEKTKQDLQKVRNKILKDIADSIPKEIEITPKDKKRNSINILYTLTLSVIMLLIGLNIGVLIK